MKVQAKNQQKPKEPNKAKRFEKNYKVLNWTVSGTFVFFILFMTMGQNPDYLRKFQDLDLFVYNSSFFIDSLQKVGGLSMYIGSFLNQFFYYPLAGSLLFLFMLLLVGWLTAKVFNLKGWSFPLAYIPSLALLWVMTELGYMIYALKIDGYVYDNIIGILLILTALLVFKGIKKLPVKFGFTFVFLILSYPLCGAFSLFGGFLMFLHLLKQAIENKQRISMMLSLVFIPIIGFIPVLYYLYIYDQIAISEIFTANLPNFALIGAEKTLWLPFFILAIFFICMVFLKPKNVQTKQSLLAKIVPVTLFFTCMTIVFLGTYKDENFNSELSMQAAADNEDWSKVLKIARNQKDEPTRQIVMTTNLALYKLGLAPDKMFFYKNGNKEIKSPRRIVPVQIAGTLFYYQYGIMNFCTRWCMEGMVEYGLSISVLKYFVLSSLLNGDYALSKKYNDVLKSTLFYKPLALKYQKYIDNPETIHNANEFKNVLALTAFDDNLTLDFDNLEPFLRIHFSKMRDVPQELTELSVLFNLDLKNNERFWPRLFRLIRFYPTKRIPVHFQEAAILYGNIERKDLTGAPFDEDVKANFKKFQEMVKQYHGFSEESNKTIFYNQFGNTFWYYYFFVNDPESQKKDDLVYKN